MRKNKKRIDPRYFLNETFEPEPVLRSQMWGPEEIERSTFANARSDAGRDFFRTTEEHYEMIRGALAQEGTGDIGSPDDESTSLNNAHIIDPNNYSQVNAATQSRDPQTIIPLGVDARYIYFKTADDIYLRIPASGA